MKSIITDCVLLETSLGGLVVDLWGVDCPATVANFIGHVAAKSYNGAVAAHLWRNNFVEFRPVVTANLSFLQLVGGADGRVPIELRNQEVGIASAAATAGKMAPVIPKSAIRFRERRGLLLRKVASSSTSQESIFILLGNGNLDYLEREYVCFGEVVEGLECLSKVNNLPISAGADQGAPLRLVRIKHTFLISGEESTACARTLSAQAVRRANGNLLARIKSLCPREILPLEDALYRKATTARLGNGDEPVSPLAHPDYSLGGTCLFSDDEGSAEAGSEAAELRTAANQAKADETRALMMQVLNGIPDSNVMPPENVLFVCKLNPVTDSEGLAACFAKFGPVKSAEVIRHRKTGASLRYAFIEFESVEACNKAFQKMDNALIDDSRIHVDFSQSVSKIWAQQRQQGGAPNRGMAPKKRDRD
jgi:peptidyl-prolyl cis-trans isomerase-like 4